MVVCTYWWPGCMHDKRPPVSACLTQVYPLQASHSWRPYGEVEGRDDRRAGPGSLWVRPTAGQVVPPSQQNNIVRPHVCHFCGYSFVRPSQLATHIRVHTGEKPFRCDMCSYSAAQKGNMRRHILLVHGRVVAGETTSAPQSTSDELP